MSMDELDRMFSVLDMDASFAVTWRGGELDRLLDEDHAALCGRCSDLLRQLGWEVLAEVTFSVYGERGSIDLLAWHAETRTLLVVEVKTEITSAEETLRRHDAKVRLAAAICRERFGASPLVVARLLAVGESSTNRARVARLASLFRARYPVRGAALRAWLRTPSGPMGGLIFLRTASGGVKATGRARIRATTTREAPLEG